MRFLVLLQPSICLLAMNRPDHLKGRDSVRDNNQHTRGLTSLTMQTLTEKTLLLTWIPSKECLPLMPAYKSSQIQVGAALLVCWCELLRLPWKSNSCLCSWCHSLWLYRGPSASMRIRQLNISGQNSEIKCLLTCKLNCSTNNLSGNGVMHGMVWLPSLKNALAADQ